MYGAIASINANTGEPFALILNNTPVAACLVALAPVTPAISAPQGELATRFRAVATDIKLGPGPDGWEIARCVRELVPTMPVVYMTGDTAQEWASKGVPGSIILAKPFAPAQLVTAIATLSTEADMQASVAAPSSAAPD